MCIFQLSPHWDFNHFVVVESWSAKKVEIIDPALGRRELTADEFDAGFTGVVLTFEPGVQFEPRRHRGRLSWHTYLSEMVRHSPGVLIQVLGASLVLQVFGLALPAFTVVLVDDVLPFRITNVMTILGIVLVIVVLAQLVASYLRAALLIYLQMRLDAPMTLGFFEHVLSLPFRFFQQRASGDMLMRLGSIETIRERLTSQRMSIVLDGSFVLVSLSLTQVMEAARLGVIHDENARMSMGYETEVAEGGSGLFGGQRQRLAIARALAHASVILVLDEATSHLDVVTKGLVDQNLSRLSCTRIVIAHLLSTIRNADLILMLDQGTIVEQGTHQELLAQQGYYAALVRSQMETAASAAPTEFASGGSTSAFGFPVCQGGPLP